MATKSSPIILYVGVVFVLGAVGLFVFSLLFEGEVRSAKPKSKTSTKSKVAAVKKPKLEPVDTLEQRLEEERRHRKEITLILLEQIKKTPKTLTLKWLADLCTYVNDEAKLNGYFDRVLHIGKKREGVYVERQRSEGKVVPNKSLYFIELAKSEFYGVRPTEGALTRASEFMATALYREAHQKGGIENVDTEFITTYFKEALKIAGNNLNLAVTKRDSAQAMKELVMVHEASLIEAQIRVERNSAMIRDKREGTTMSAAGDLLRLGKISTRVNAGLLALGKIYLGAAERETVSRRKIQYNAEYAFTALSMVYQRTSSGEALNVMREVNDIQRGYLRRMARLNWKNAKEAAKVGNWADVDEHFFTATQRYLQAMSRAGEVRRAKIKMEYDRFKKDVAKLKTGKGAATAEQQS